MPTDTAGARIKVLKNPEPELFVHATLYGTRQNINFIAFQRLPSTCVYLIDLIMGNDRVKMMNDMNYYCDSNINVTKWVSIALTITMCYMWYLISFDIKLCCLYRELEEQQGTRHTIVVTYYITKVIKKYVKNGQQRLKFHGILDNRTEGRHPIFNH